MTTKELLTAAMKNLIEAAAIFESLPTVNELTIQAVKWRHDALLSVLGEQLTALKDTMEILIEKANE